MPNKSKLCTAVRHRAELIAHDIGFNGQWLHAGSCRQCRPKNKQTDLSHSELAVCRQSSHVYAPLAFAYVVNEYM